MAMSSINHIKRLSGFSLIEISITLVVIALIVGGVLVGNNLIRSAELRSVANDISTYSSAANAFKEKYRYLPGDLPTATSFWGTNPACFTDSTTRTTLTCNGNGDMGISFICPGGGCFSPEPYYDGPAQERLLFWQHLADAGMIPGQYTGNYAPCVTCTHGGIADMIGYSVPASKIKGGAVAVINAGINWFTVGGIKIPAAEDDPCYGNPFCMCSDCGLSAMVGSQPVFTPEEAWGIDNKMDDGMPASGTVLMNDGTNCWVWDGSAYQYDMDNANVACSLKFRAGF